MIFLTCDPQIILCQLTKFIVCLAKNSQRKGINTIRPMNKSQEGDDHVWRQHSSGWTQFKQIQSSTLACNFDILPANDFLLEIYG